jgi:site-specific DNA recombinase
MRIIRKVEQPVPCIPTKKRVAAYARVSSGKDAMHQSLSAQISYYNAYIQNHRNWEYAGVYADEAITGTKSNRVEFQRLLQDCRDGKIDIILTKSISRFARNTVDLLETIRMLRELNVEVYFERENISSLSMEGELMLTILASFAQEESKSVSDNCKWRIRKQFSEGELANLRFMFGYRINKGEIEVDPEQAAVVRMIFDDYINGMGGTKIAAKLRDMGIPTELGGEWRDERIHAIIKNEKYTGNALLQKKFVVDHLTKKQVRNKGQLKQYFAEGTHPAIIDIETFNKANEIMEQRRRAFHGDRRALELFPFKGIIHCSICGKDFIRKKVREKYFWRCSTYQKKGKTACPSKQIPEQTLFEKSAEALDINEFDETVFAKMITKIRVPAAYRLEFIFTDGHIYEKTWHNQSRSKSWIYEMREAARQKAIERRHQIWQNQ